VLKIRLSTPTLEGGFICFLLVVSVLVVDTRRMFVMSWCVSFFVIKYLLRSYQ
jgi:hypothetical protein